ncbi:hypothetical protein ACLKA7_013936 [Drosophila subpalustris]
MVVSYAHHVRMDARGCTIIHNERVPIASHSHSHIHIHIHHRLINASLPTSASFQLMQPSRAAFHSTSTAILRTSTLQLPLMQRVAYASLQQSAKRECQRNGNGNIEWSTQRTENGERGMESGAWKILRENDGCCLLEVGRWVSGDDDNNDDAAGCEKFCSPGRQL